MLLCDVLFAGNQRQGPAEGGFFPRDQQGPPGMGRPPPPMRMPPPPPVRQFLGLVPPINVVILAEPRRTRAKGPTTWTTTGRMDGLPATADGIQSWRARQRLRERTTTVRWTTASAGWRSDSSDSRILPRRTPWTVPRRDAWAWRGRTRRWRILLGIAWLHA